MTFCNFYTSKYFVLNFVCNFTCYDVLFLSNLLPSLSKEDATAKRRRSLAYGVRK